MTKILAMSNIHGRYQEMVTILSRIKKEHGFQSFDKIVFMGDYIAFGDKNIEVIKLLLRLKHEYPNVVLLRGSWEDILHRVQRPVNKDIQQEAYQFFQRNGQTEMLKTLRADKSLVNRWLDEIEDMPLFHVEGDYFLSHAGPDLSEWGTTDVNEFLEQIHNPYLFMWGLEHHLSYIDYWANRMVNETESFPRFPYKIVFGQTALNKIYKEDKATKYNGPFQIGDAYGIDFGGIYTKGQLGAVVFEENGVKSYITDVLPVAKKARNKQTASKAKVRSK